MLRANFSLKIKEYIGKNIKTFRHFEIFHEKNQFSSSFPKTLDFYNNFVKFDNPF